MKMTRWLAVTVCGVGLSAGLAMAQTPNVKNRQKVQQARIAHGARTGELTAREARRLENNQRRIHRTIVHDRRDGGAFAARERARAQRRLSRQSRAIRRQTHDRQSR